MKKKTCVYCHMTYTPTYRNRQQFYCSTSCRLKDYKETRKVLRESKRNDEHKKSEG